jgi:Flp pilus assembly pilin Flp
MRNLFLARLLRKIHADEEGAVSLETILIIAAVALPILIFLYKVAWPRVQNMFNTRMQPLEDTGTGTP